MKLLEIKGPDSLASNKIKRFANILKRDCMPFLQQIDFKVAEYPMYRGGYSKRKRANISKNTRLQNRRPLDTPNLVHSLINDYFTKTFGEPFRNSVYTTGNLYVGNVYGNVFLIFPIGNFTFLWSPKIPDLYDRDFATSSDWLETVYAGEYTTQNLKEAIKSGNEIMIRVPKYHAINLIKHKHITPYLKNLPKQGITPEELQQLQEELLK